LDLIIALSKVDTSILNPAASAVVDVIVAVCFPWVPAAAMVSVVAGVPAAVIILTALDVPGVSDVA
jgi:hypothetical protein